MDFLRTTVVKYLRNVADKIEAGNSNINEEQAMEILSVLANEELSKDLACSYMNMSRSRFDELVRQGRIPKGKKVRGYKELRWYKRDLIKVTSNEFDC